jgi:hypothetical protein
VRYGLAFFEIRMTLEGRSKSVHDKWDYVLVEFIDLNQPPFADLGRCEFDAIELISREASAVEQEPERVPPASRNRWAVVDTHQSSELDTKPDLLTHLTRRGSRR